MTVVLSKFPFETPRASQRDVILAIEKAFKDFDVIILEGPVGSGKSAIAETLVRHYGQGHILTPRKSLQDQYLDDFQKYGLVSMKGKGAYPCIPGNDVTYQGAPDEDEYVQAVNIIQSGYSPAHIVSRPEVRSVSKGACVVSGKISQERALKCQGRSESGGGELHECPFVWAVQTAWNAPQVVHNLHSFMYQNLFSQLFPEAELLVLDEAHEVESVVRDFIRKIVRLRYAEVVACKEKMPRPEASMDDWIAYLTLFTPDEKDEEEHNAWVDTLGFLETVKDSFLKDRVTYIEKDDESRSFKITFMPRYLGSAPANLFFDYGKKVLLMSGTIYDKEYFCRTLGIRKEDAAFIRLSSEFPLNTRPVILSKKLMTDNSFAAWRDKPETFDNLLSNICEVMDRHKGVKGLIHAPSYFVARQLEELLGPRVLGHDPDNFNHVLEEFYNREDDTVLISPICQQGVDMKYDRARFQMIIRIPYPNASDPFISEMMKSDFKWYNHQALVVFGQMLGRVNRSSDDYGVTYLMDSRFHQFIRRNQKKLPPWQTAAFTKTE